MKLGLLVWPIYIPSSMMKIVINFVDTSSFSTVTSSCQKTSLTRMKLAHARMTHIPRSMMKIIINFVDRSPFSIVTSSCQKTSQPRMKLPLTRMTHKPSSMMKIIINFVDRSPFSIVTICLQKCHHSVWNWHMLVWPIYQAQSSRLSSNALKHHHNL